MSEEYRVGRFTEQSIDWDRPYDIGPSDQHLHAIGQFVTIYSNIEWQIFGLFAFYLEIPAPAVRQLVADANISMAGIIRSVEKHVAASTADTQARDDLLLTLKAFDSIAKVRHKIIHWQWGLDEGTKAQLNDFIRQKANNSSITLDLKELRSSCFRLVRIIQAVIFNGGILMGQISREEILRLRSDTLPETLFRP